MIKFSISKKFLMMLLGTYLVCTSLAFGQDSTGELELYIQELAIYNDLGENVGSKLIYGINELETKIGEKLDVEKITNDLENLKKEHEELYENVELEVLPLDETHVSIKFEMQKKRLIKRIIIKLFDNENLEDEIDNNLREKLKLRRGAYFKSKQMLEDLNRIEDFYKLKGHALVEVKKSLKLNREDEISIIFDIHLKSKEIKIDNIDFVGNHSITSRQLKELISSKESHLFSKNLFIEKVFYEDAETIKRHYMEQGFINIEVTPSFKINKNKTDLHFTIKENNQLKLDHLTIKGNTVFSNDEILKTLAINLPSAFSIKKQREAIQNLRELYGQKGYVFAHITMNYDHAKRSANLNIEEGSSQKIIKMEIVGNTKTSPEVIYEMISIYNGQVVDTKKINESILALYKSGYFKDVKIDYTPMTKNAGKIIIQVQENSTQTIQFSLGSVYGGAGFGVSLSDGNLFGTGSSLALTTMISKEINRIGLVYNDQHLFGTNISLNISANHDTERSFHYNENKTAIRILFEKQLTKNIKLGLGTRLEYVSVNSLSQQYASEIDLSDTKDIVSGLIGSFAYQFEESSEEGLRTNGAISIHLLPSFNQQDLFFKSIVNAQLARDLYRNQDGAAHRLSGRITLGYASEQTPFYERLQGGGNGTIRGFEYGSISKDGQLGSNSMVSANLTYSMPIYKDVFSGVLFLDAFSPGDSSFALDDFRLVGGLGLRAKMDAGFVSETFEAGLTIPLISKDGDITKPFYFIIGEYDPAYNL
ncbi:outer membrane protein assembly factor [Halobacteriovorax sp. ZH1_bin.1]|uniref:BamA/OMP85 family outer membrane protein n=1 Tax=Halobacteriovorax sp. ZH1_bin.1 TaxID=3157723 RepID=UPI00372462C3